MQDLDALAVQIHVLALLVVRFGRPAAVGYGGVLPVGALIRDNTFSADEWPPRRRSSCPRQLVVGLKQRPAGFSDLSFPPTWSPSSLVSMT